MAAPTKMAVLYRMIMPEHVCAYGLKTRYLLRRHGYFYVDRRELTCTCVGGGSKVPPGFVSLTEMS